MRGNATKFKRKISRPHVISRLSKYDASISVDKSRIRVGCYEMKLARNRKKIQDSIKPHDITSNRKSKMSLLLFFCVIYLCITNTISWKGYSARKLL